MEFPGADPRAPPALALDEALLPQVADRLPGRLAGHRVCINEFLVGGEVLAELTLAQPAAQVLEQLRPERQRARAVQEYRAGLAACHRIILTKKYVHSYFSMIYH